jgi:hypothetical protein
VEARATERREDIEIMLIVEHVVDGRKYKAYSDGSEEGIVIIGPPEGMVDELGMPEPFATRLHNILYARGFFSHADVVKVNNGLMGALQEALSIDVQKLNEYFFECEKGD